MFHLGFQPSLLVEEFPPSVVGRVAIPQLLLDFLESFLGRFANVVWALYGILAGIAGVLLGMFLGVSSYSVGPLTASAFSIVVLGGLGSVSGSLIAAFVVGYLETLTAYLVSPAYRTIPALLLLIIVMYIRPQGLLGRR